MAKETSVEQMWFTCVEIKKGHTVGWRMVASGSGPGQGLHMWIVKKATGLTGC